MRRHMIEFGTTEEQFGAVAVACRRHANLNPDAVMHGRRWPWPTTSRRRCSRIRCGCSTRASISDGGAAYVTTSVERGPRPAAAAGRRRRRGRGLLGLGHALGAADRVHQLAAGVQRARRFAMAGSRRATSTCLPSTTRSPSCRSCRSRTWASARRARPALRRGRHARTTIPAASPFNTHGGLLSHAYVLGIADVVEIVKQLRGAAAAQVPDCEVAVYGGYTGPHGEHARAHEGSLRRIMAITRADFPLPDVDDPLTAEFFAAAARGELVFPRCAPRAGSSGTRPRSARSATGAALEWVPVRATRPCSPGRSCGARSCPRSPSGCRS